MIFITKRTGRALLRVGNADEAIHVYQYPEGLLDCFVALAMTA
jgi:hypothetical protein